ncbi:MAG: Flp family type IVb pilin [Pseudomonadota bacterium]
MTRFKALKSNFKAFIACEAGTTAIEYGVIALFLSTTIVAGASAIGSSDVVTLEAITSVWPQ